jgi:hypothetical protein
VLHVVGSILRHSGCGHCQNGDGHHI